MENLVVCRYQFNFEVLTPLPLNFYSGSMLRGAFGWALRQLSCMTKMPVCADCLLYRTCPYPLVFAPPLPDEQRTAQKLNEAPSPYIIEPPPLGSRLYQVGEVLSFSMVLMGEAIKQLPLIIFAWQRALAFGLGKTRAQARLLNVVLEPNQPHAHIIYNATEEATVLPHSVLTLPSLPITPSVSLHFITPLRIQQQGKLLSHSMTAKDFLMALVRRYHLLQTFHCQTMTTLDFADLAARARDIQCDVNFRPCDWQRYSHRQQQVMEFRGVLGSLTLTGDLQPFLPFIQAGLWLHVGNKTTFGMGGYQLA